MTDRNYGPFNLPFTNGEIEVKTTGRIKLGKRHFVWPWEARPYFQAQDDQPAWNTFTTNGTAMLHQLGLKGSNLYIKAGYTLLAALIISDRYGWFVELANMRKHTEDGKNGMLLKAALGSAFGLTANSQIFFSDALHGTLTYERLGPPPQS